MVMKTAVFFISLILTLLNAGCDHNAEEPYPYLEYLPENYESSQDSIYPLVFFLHGSGERGHDLEKLKVYGIPKEIGEGRKIPAIVIAPQVPLFYNEFFPDKLQTTLETVIDKHSNVDTRRIYATGLSMGGRGTWDWAIAYPANFAAILPLCGYTDPRNAAVISHLPVWVFHGDQDDVVPISESQEMVDALLGAGGDPKFTIYKGLGHNIWDTTYANPAIYEWMFAHSQ